MTDNPPVTESWFGWDTKEWWRLDPGSEAKWEPVQEVDVPAYLVKAKQEQEEDDG